MAGIQLPDGADDTSHVTRLSFCYTPETRTSCQLPVEALGNTMHLAACHAHRPQMRDLRQSCPPSPAIIWADHIQLVTGASAGQQQAVVSSVCCPQGRRRTGAVAGPVRHSCACIQRVHGSSAPCAGTSTGQHQAAVHGARRSQGHCGEGGGASGNPGAWHGLRRVQRPQWRRRTANWRRQCRETAANAKTLHARAAAGANTRCGGQQHTEKSAALHGPEWRHAGAGVQLMGPACCCSATRQLACSRLAMFQMWCSFPAPRFWVSQLHEFRLPAASRKLCSAPTRSKI